MPSVSQKQHNLMAMVANDPAKAKQLGIPQSVGEEYMKADKGRKFGKGERPDRQVINKPETRHGKTALFAKGGEMKESKAMAKKEISFMEKKGAPKSMIKHEKEEYGMKKGGMMKKYAAGGSVMERDGISTAKMGKVTAGGKRAHGEHTVQSKGHTKGKMVTMSGGKPLGTQTKTMKRGGKC